MNITYSNGSSFIGTYVEQKFKEAIEDPTVVRASVYRPGEIIGMSDRKYKVGRAGNLIRIRD